MSVKRYGPHHSPRTNEPPKKGVHPGVPRTGAPRDVRVKPAKEAAR